MILLDTLKTYVYPAAVDTHTNRIKNAAAVNFGLKDKFHLSSAGKRRAQLYVALLKEPILQEKDIIRSSSAGYHPSSDYGYSKGRVYKNMEGHRYKETPDDIKKALERLELVAIPSDFHPGFQNRPPLDKPYLLPDLDQIKDIPLQSGISIAIPPVSQDSVKVKQPSISPYMDLSNRSIASRMVAAGLQPSEMAEEYQANWSKEKTCRDILQNFFDSHGQTLEGIRIEIQHVKTEGNSAEYHVIIYGLGQYDYEKTYVLGASDKQEDDSSVGGYGEGLKIIALNLLRDYDARYVKVASANWAMTYTLPREQKTNGHTSKLYNKLEYVPKPKEQPSGNYFEFSTTSPELVQTLLKATDYFYHPYNPDFQNQTYENEVGGFHILPPDEKGNAYIAMQRYEYEKKGDWDRQVPGITLWKRTKSEKSSADRDRTHISSLEAVNLIGNIIEKMSKEEIVFTINKLKPYWIKKNTKISVQDQILTRLINRLRFTEKSKTTFPKQYVADNLEMISSLLKGSRVNAENAITAKGFILCNRELGYIGMPLASDVLAEIAPKQIKEKPDEEEPLKKLFDSSISEPVKTPSYIDRWIQLLKRRIKSSQSVDGLNQVPLTPQEQIRFQVLSLFLTELGTRLPYPFSVIHSNKLCLGSTNDYYSGNIKVGSNYQSVIQISGEQLKQQSLDNALLSLISLFLKKSQGSGSDSDYTYHLTDFSIALTQLLLSSEFAEKYADLKAIWDASWQNPSTYRLTKAAR